MILLIYLHAYHQLIEILIALVTIYTDIFLEDLHSFIFYVYKIRPTEAG